jgi:large subunit ribosomal protein L25
VSVEGLTPGTQIHASDVVLPEGTTLRTDAEILVVNVVAAPTAAQVEASMDTEGAGVVEEPPSADSAGSED